MYKRSLCKNVTDLDYGKRVQMCICVYIYERASNVLTVFTYAIHNLKFESNFVPFWNF